MGCQLRRIFIGVVDPGNDLLAGFSDKSLVPKTGIAGANRRKHFQVQNGVLPGNLWHTNRSFVAGAIVELLHDRTDTVEDILLLEL